MLTVHSHSSSREGDSSGIQYCQNMNALGFGSLLCIWEEFCNVVVGWWSGHVKFKTGSPVCLVSFAWPPLIFRPEATEPMQFTDKISTGVKFSPLDFHWIQDSIHLYYKWIWIGEPENKLVQEKVLSSLPQAWSWPTLVFPSQEIPPGIPSKPKSTVVIEAFHFDLTG